MSTAASAGFASPWALCCGRAVCLSGSTRHGFRIFLLQMLAATIALDAASGAMSERGVREGSPAARQLAQTQEMHELRSFMSPEVQDWRPWRHARPSLLEGTLD